MAHDALYSKRLNLKIIVLTFGCQARSYFERPGAITTIERRN